MWHLLFTLFPLIIAQGCYDDGDGRFNARIDNYVKKQNEGLKSIAKRSQSGTHVPPISKFRDIHWGDLNIVHVTDTHGWLSGHLNNQDQYSADWGDFASFTDHLNAEAEKRGVDILYVETGDRHDGTGLSDATPIDGQLSNKVFTQTPFDIIGIGNHELYKNDVIDQEYSTLRPFYGDHYLSGNVDIWKNNTWQPLGDHFRIFETKHKKLRVLAFSFLFDFKGNANHSRVTEVETAVKEPWFKQVINRTDYDLVLVTGHIPVRGFKEFDTIINAIREVKPTIPIQGFGGHSHVRDFRVFDDHAVALESGRYLETIGWASITMQSNGSTSFSRRYIDFNTENLAYHVNRSLTSFTTEKGAAISQQIANLRQNLSLDNDYGIVDRDYQVEWAPFMSKNSLFTLVTQKIHPLLKSNVSRDNLPRVILGNTGNYRYPLLKGQFSKDQKYIVSPFSNPWLYAADVPVDIALSVLGHLNKDYSYIKRSNNGYNVTTSPLAGETPSSLAPASSTHIPTVLKQRSSLGYVTHDDFGSEGDDTIHQPYKVYTLPNAFQTKQFFQRKTTHADVVFGSFLLSKIEPFLKEHGWNGTIRVYGPGFDRDLFEQYYTKQTERKKHF